MTNYNGPDADAPAQGQQPQLPPAYDESKLIPALRKAHAAGDVPAARALARRIMEVRRGEIPDSVRTAAGPWEKYQQAQPAQEGPWTRHQSQPLRLSDVTGQAPAARLKLSDVQAQSNPRLTPVDYNPFAQQQGPRLVPVEGDPFAEAPAAPKRSNLETYVTRPLGQAARYGLEGLAGTIGIFSDPLAYAMGGERASALASRAADAMGLPKPEGALEEVVAGASRAVAGGAPILRAGQVSAQAPGLAGRVGQSLAASPRMQTASAALGGASASTAAQMGAGPTGQFFAGLAGALAPSSAAMTLRGAVRGGEAGRQSMSANIDSFQRAGVASPSIGQASEGRVARGAEVLLGRVPGGAGVMERAGTAQQQAMGQRVAGLADQLSTRASPEQAGRAIERGIVGPNGFMVNFRNQASELYDRVDQFIPPTTPIAVSRTKATLDTLARPTPGAAATSRVLTSGRVADIRNALDADMQASLAAAGRGELPYEAVKSLRSRMGELIADSTFATDVPTKQLRQVYAALSDDLNAAAVATGNPKAIQAVTRANNYYKFGMARMEQLERVIERNGGPEKVFAAATSGSREGATTLRAVMQSLPQDARKQLVAAVVRRMGRATPGAQDDIGEQFSSERFLTMWNTLAPEAKTTLFARMGPTYLRDMEAVAKTAASIRSGAQVFRNPPGTAQATAQIATAASLILSVAKMEFGTAAAIGSGVGTANLAARLMTNPRLVGWLARQTKVPSAALPAQIAKLKVEAQVMGDPEMLEAAYEIERLTQQLQGRQ
ncbi:hypothetical protein [Arenimonas sp.]|uniref:hypothetical protein n=1 Tax=Arenimonas sp. TaxID=1872635 RepID=UPI002E313CCB|nr:hypothetical protein [Arenimonas sp.]HEX4852755.1 hypothetical protein [Arenimonas sp.]